MAFNVTLEQTRWMERLEESRGDDGALGRKWEETVEREGAVCSLTG